jgi:hypothetical protein
MTVDCYSPGIDVPAVSITTINDRVTGHLEQMTAVALFHDHLAS